MTGSDIGSRTVSQGPQITLDPQQTSCDPTDYLLPDGFLFINIWNSTPGTNVKVYVTQLDPSGRVVVALFQVFPTSDRTTNSFSFPLTEGFLMQVAVVGTATTSIGRTFVRVAYEKAASFVNLILCQGYLSSQVSMSWPNGSLRNTNEPHGYFRSITGTLPAAGGEIIETVPAGALWRLISVNYSLTTGAVVANRLSGFIIDDGTSNLLVLPGINNSVASNTYGFNVVAGNQLSYGAAFPMNWPIPGDLFMPSGFRFRTLTTNIQAADQYTAPQYLVEEFINS